MASLQPFAFAIAARSASSSSRVGATAIIMSFVTVISDPIAAETLAVLGQHLELARDRPATSPVRFDSSAYWATMRRVFFSPWPPIMIGILEIGGGRVGRLASPGSACRAGSVARRAASGR